ncbi:MAG: hypothetical protein ACRDY7_01195 [Acidimicrobiia bacterium]
MPTVTAQLASMATAMERVVLPALPADAIFAREQAGLVWATLNWLVDVHASEYRYEAAEGDDYRALLGALLALDGADGSSEVPEVPEMRAVLDEPVAGTGPTTGDLVAVRDQTRRMKALAVGFLASSGDIGPELRRGARELVMGVAERQVRREQAWFRMTGFPQDVPGDIAAVLAGER